MTRFGIVGGGFGLYAYLPAVITRTLAPIATLGSYRKMIAGRDELRPFLQRLMLCDSVNEVLTRSDVVVVARRPVDQESLINLIVQSGWRGSLLLEKPLAPTPERGEMLLARLGAADIRFRIGFLFPLTPWFNEWNNRLALTRESYTRIDWRFLAHHYRTATATWKRDRHEGGGALRFYGIHIIAALATLGKWRVIEAPQTTTNGDESDCRFTVAQGAHLVEVNLLTNWRKRPKFRLLFKSASSSSHLIDEEEPLAASRGLDGALGNTPGRLDGRCKWIGAIIDSLGRDDLPFETIYHQHISLWRDLETHLPKN